MDDIIRNANFCHDDEDVYEEFEVCLRNWINANRQTCTSQQLLQAFDALAHNLLGDTCPTCQSRGWNQALVAYDVLSSLADNLITSSRMESTDLYKMYLEHTVEFHRHGPASIHVEVMTTNFRRSELYVGECTKILQGTDVMKVISAVCTPIIKREDTEPSKYYRYFMNEIESILREHFNDTNLQEEECMNKMMNYAVYLLLNYSQVPEEGYLHIARTAKFIFDYFKDMWMKSDNIPQLSLYIQQIIDFMNNQELIKSKVVHSCLTDVINRLREKAKGSYYVQRLGELMIELLGCISRNKSEHEDMQMEMFNSVLYFFRENTTAKIFKEPAIFTVLVPPFKKLLSEIDNEFLYNTFFVRDLMCVLEKSFGRNVRHMRQWLGLAADLFHRPSYSGMQKCINVLSEDQIIFRWDEYKDIADQVFQAIISMRLPTEDFKFEEFFNPFNVCINSFFDGLRNANMIKDCGEGLMYFSCHLLELGEIEYFKLAKDTSGIIEIDVEEKKDSVMDVINRLHVLIKKNLLVHSGWKFQTAVHELLENLLEHVKDSTIFTDDDLKSFVSFCATSLSFNCINPVDKVINGYFVTAVRILTRLLPWLGATERIGFATELIPLLVRLYKHKNEQMFILCGHFFSTFAKYEPEVIAPYLGQLLQAYLDTMDKHILSPINQLFPVNPSAMKEHFQGFISLLDSQDEVNINLSDIFSQVSRKYSELFTEHNIQTLMNRAQNDTVNESWLSQILHELSKRQPAMMLRHLDDLMAPDTWSKSFLCTVHEMVCCLALNQKNVANEVLDFLLSNAQDTQDRLKASTALIAARLVVFKYPSIMIPKLPEINSLQVGGYFKEVQKSITDIINGTLTNDLKLYLEEKQYEYTKWATSVEGTITAVEEIEKNDDQDAEREKEKIDIAEPGQLLEQLMGRLVEENVLKEKEIDDKTELRMPWRGPQSEGPVDIIHQRIAMGDAIQSESDETEQKTKNQKEEAVEMQATSLAASMSKEDPNHEQAVAARAHEAEKENGTSKNSVNLKPEAVVKPLPSPPVTSATSRPPAQPSSPGKDSKSKTCFLI